MGEAHCISSTASNRADSPRRHWYSRRWLQVAASVVLVVWLLRVMDLDRARLLESTSHVRWWLVVLALMLRPVAVWARAWQAALLLASAGIGLTVREVWRAFMFGEMLSRFVPGNLGTVAYVAKLSRQLGVAFAAQLLDRILFLTLTLTLAALSLLGAGHRMWALIAVVALLGVLLLAYGLYCGVVRWGALSSEHRGTIERVLKSGKDWGGAYVVASMLSLALTSILFGLLVVACAGNVHMFAMLAAVALVTIGAAVPITINGVGIREWVFMALLDETLPTGESVVTLASLTYLVGFASALFGVATWALLGQRVKSRDAEG